MAEKQGWSASLERVQRERRMLAIQKKIVNNWPKDDGEPDRSARTRFMNRYHNDPNLDPPEIRTCRLGARPRNMKGK